MHLSISLDLSHLTISTLSVMCEEPEIGTWGVLSAESSGIQQGSPWDVSI